MSSTSPEILEACKLKLITTKAELLNRLRQAKEEFFARDKGTDEADQSMAILAEGEFLRSQDRLRTQLLEIERALLRIEQGSFGFCEETEEPIEVDRLLAIPWTRLSLEGAEIQESLKKKFAKQTY